MKKAEEDIMHLDRIGGCSSTPAMGQERIE
jgi:hypothetical protein